MASPRTSSASIPRGFTLLEIIIVMSLVTIVGGLSLVVSMDAFRGYSFRDERDLIVSALHRARSQAVNNMCFTTGAPCTDGKAHGVRVEANQYVIFQVGDASVDEVLESKYASAAVSGFTEVVFSPLSGNASTSPTGQWTLTVTDADGTSESVITIGAEGQVSWTH